VFGDLHCMHRDRKQCACQFDAPGSILFAQFDFEGNCLRSSYVPHRENKLIWLGYSRIIPTGEKGRFLMSFAYEDLTSRIIDRKHHGLFDEEAFEFSPIQWPEKTKEWRSSLPDSDLGTNTLFWKDTFCSFSTTDESVYRLLQGGDDVDAPTPIFKEKEPIEPHEDNSAYLHFLMNERYLVRTFNQLLYVVCFDEDNRFPKASGPFPEANAHVEVLLS
jgi:hypothetical protein